MGDLSVSKRAIGHLMDGEGEVLQIPRAPYALDEEQALHRSVGGWNDEEL